MTKNYELYRPSDMKTIYVNDSELSATLAELTKGGESVLVSYNDKD